MRRNFRLKRRFWNVRIQGLNRIRILDNKEGR